MTLQKPKDYRDLLNVCAEYVQREQGDTNYEIAHWWVEQHWPDPVKVAGGIRILEETWNRDFYDQRRGIFHMECLGQAIKQHTSALDQLRRRHIETFVSGDHAVTQILWDIFFEVLIPQKKPERPRVATAKALHLLVPTFFVPYDSKIADNYGCNRPEAQDYIRFQQYMAESASNVLDSFVMENGGNCDQARVAICGCLYTQQTGSHYGKTLPKLLDEYNFMVRY